MLVTRPKPPPSVVPFFYSLLSFDQMNAPDPILPCTFVWDAIYGSIECEDIKGLDEPPLSTNISIARSVPNAQRDLVGWIIDQIPTPIQIGGRFWFYFDSRPDTLLLGELSTIHVFFGAYAVIEISPILHFDWNHGWVVDDGDLFWMNVHDLVLDRQQEREAQRALLRNPTFSLFSNHNSDEE